MGRRKGQRGKPRGGEVAARAPDPQAALLCPRAWVASVITFVGLLALYVGTLAPSVMGGDSGELTASVLTGGAPHPPGYPLFALLARVFAALPLGHSPAWRVNLLSATATAVAGALVCATVALWTRAKAAGLVAAALFGTNSVVWLHATSAEVFGLNVMFVLGFCILSNLSTSHGLYLTVMLRFCIQSDLLLAIAAGLGVARLGQHLRGRFAACERHARWAPVAALLVFVAGASAHAGECNQRHNRVFADFVTTAFATLPQGAIVITMGDHLTGSVFYFHEVEKLRPDVIHLDRELLGTSWYSQRKRRLYPDLFVPQGTYGKGGWNIKKLLDGNPTRPLVVIDRLDAWDQSWKDGYKLATNGLVHPIVPASQFPDFEQWFERDRKALGSYDVLPALRASEGSWENALAQMVMTSQGGRAHLALVYSNENNNTPAPARVSVGLLEDIVAKAGGDKTLGIAGQPDLRPLPLGPTVWKDLGIGYEILARTDPAYAPKVAAAYEKFVERAEPDDKDVPAARQYVEQHRQGH